MTDRQAREQRFLDELKQAGHYQDLGTPGSWGRSAALESVVEGLSAAIRRMFAVAAPVEVAFTPLENREVFANSGYVRSFPQLIGEIDVFTGTDRDHRALLADCEAGRPWHEHLSPSEFMLVSAACHPLYGMLGGSVVDNDRYTVSGWCFRHEPSGDPFRTVMFRQREIVLLGSADFVLDERNRWMVESEALLRTLGLDVAVETATDPFFGRAGRLMAQEQRQAALKVELTIAAYGDDVSRTALASGNNHGHHFTETFDMTLPDGSRASSACMGFGIERVALALVKTHGLDIDAWPANVREELGLVPVSRPPRVRRVPTPTIEVPAATH